MVVEEGERDSAAERLRASTAARRPTHALTAADHERSVANLKLERDAIVLYDGLAAIERDPGRAAAFRRIASNERRHATIWAERLERSGSTVPPLHAPRARIRFILLVARLLGTRAVSDLVRALEGDEEDAYEAQDGPEVAAIAADEREHAEIWRRLGRGASGPEGADPAVPQADEPVAAHRRAFAGGETWHRAGQSGALRAAVFGVNDGLVSNLSLVMGVTGASADNRIIVLAGVAGLLAGSFSMAAGEYISMQSQRELFQRQIEVEREEMRVMPDEEERELAAIYRAKGLPAADAERIARHLMEDPDAALDTKVREELGLDPDELGSPWAAAGSSFVMFALGALVPLAPYLLGRGANALIAAVVVSSLALFAIGAAVSLLTGRNALYSGMRQVLIGGAASAVTFAVGAVIGFNVGQ